MGLIMSTVPEEKEIISFFDLKCGDIFRSHRTVHLLMKCEVNIGDGDYEIAIDLYSGSKVSMEDDDIIDEVIEKGTKLIVS